MKIIAGLTAAALVAGALASPAEARDWRHHRHDDRIDGGDVVAGALVIGGIAAIASAIAEGNRAKQDAAVDACSQEAESREGGRVSEIYGVTKSKGYYTVEGELDSRGGEDDADVATPARLSFTCTVRNGSIYGFRTSGGGSRE